MSPQHPSHPAVDHLLYSPIRDCAPARYTHVFDQGNCSDSGSGDVGGGSGDVGGGSGDSDSSSSEGGGPDGLGRWEDRDCFLPSNVSRRVPVTCFVVMTSQCNFTHNFTGGGDIFSCPLVDGRKRLTRVIMRNVDVFGAYSELGSGGGIMNLINMTSA